MTRLRIPAALAVAVVGSSATLALSIAGCDEATTPVPVDGPRTSSTRLDGGFDGDFIHDVAPALDAPESPHDAAVDAPIDAPLG